jgi:putative sugar O-methyltransferase
MLDYPELTQALDDMREQDSVYRPTTFWQESSAEIVKELCTHGIENFRSLPTALGFFVPTYGAPGGGFSLAQIKKLKKFADAEWQDESKLQLTLTRFLDGYSAALADYRVLRASDDASTRPWLHKFTESNVGNPVEQFEFDSQIFSRSALNYLLGMSMLKKHLNGEIPQTVLEVGGGFGTLGEVLASAAISDLRYIDIDIPPTSFVAQYYLTEVFGKDDVAGYAQTAQQDRIFIDQLPQAAALCPWQIERLQGNVDLFVNFISFQEMEPHVVNNYLKQVARLNTKWVLLRNLREGKSVAKNKTVGVKRPILSEDYLKMLPSYELIERNVNPFGYQTVDGFNSELLLLKRKP